MFGLLFKAPPHKYAVCSDWSAHTHLSTYNTTDEAFQEQCFLWERGASVGVDFGLFNSQDLFLIRKYI